MAHTINGHLRGDQSIDSDTDLTGMIVGNVIVKESCVLNVFGVITGDLIINRQAQVLINGRVNGNIFNAGACTINGVVNGLLKENSGHFNIDPKAVISTSR